MGAAITFAIIQRDIAWLDSNKNFEQLREWALTASRQADFIVLAETFSTGFAVNNLGITEEMGKQSREFLLDIASELHVWIAGSFIEKCGTTDSENFVNYNTCMVAGPRGEAFEYRKLHPFTPGGEHRDVLPGSKIQVISIGGIRLTPFLCYDLRFANIFWDSAHDTDVFVVMANWPQTRQSHWNTLLSSRAIENQAYVVGCNRIGAGGGNEYHGGSQVVDPSGRVVASLGNESAILFAQIDPHLVQLTRSSFPCLADRRHGDSYTLEMNSAAL